MAGLWKNNEGTREGKYLVKRRDGTIPQWPWFVLAASDPAAPRALRAYADEAERRGMDNQYVFDIRKAAYEFEAWHQANPPGDPDAGKHRTDDPEIIAQMSRGRSL